jgi:hypothetical protein
MLGYQGIFFTLFMVFLFVCRLYANGYNMLKLFYSFLQQLKTIAEVVKSNTVGNPVEIEQKCEEIVCQVLKGLYVGNQNIDLHTYSNKAVPNATRKCSEPLISSPSFKIDPDDKALSNKDETGENVLPTFSL